jgi:hypothetical protein
MRRKLGNVKLFVVLLALAALQACSAPLPPTDKPLNAGPALVVLSGILGTDITGTPVYGLTPDPDCGKGPWGWRDHEGDGQCHGGVTIDGQVWLVVIPGQELFSVSGLQHEALHLLGRHHAGADYVPGSADAVLVERGRAALAAMPAADRIEVRR